MNKLILLCGISGSGKSTWASRTVQHNPEQYVRVSRDKIREMLYGYTENNVSEYYHRKDIHKLEQQVTFIENSVIYDFLDVKPKTVIVDATHLKAKYLNRYSEFDADEIEIAFFDVSLEEAIKRNNLRIRKVDEEIIVKQHENYLNIKKFLTTNKLKFDYICTKEN